MGLVDSMMGLWTRLTRIPEERVLSRKRRLDFESRENGIDQLCCWFYWSRTSVLGLTLALFSVLDRYLCLRNRQGGVRLGVPL